MRTLHEIRKRVEHLPEATDIIDQTIKEEYPGFEEFKNLQQSESKKRSKSSKKKVKFNFGDVLRREFNQQRV